MRNLAGALLLVISASAIVGFAQLPTGTILGGVRDATGATLPGTTLTATNTETGLSRMTLSGEDGSYRFPALPVGRYEIRAEIPGFQTAVRSGVTLAVGQEAVVNFRLEVGAVSQTVEVKGEAPLVNVTSSSLGGLVTEDNIADLPLNGRNFIDLTFLQPGVSENKNMTHGGTFTGSWFSSNGAPLRSNTYMLDGAVMGNFLGGATSSMAKDTAFSLLGESGKLEFRAEFFNVVNHANFATPEIGLGDTPSAALVFPGSQNETGPGGVLIPQPRLPSVSKILKTSTSSRQIQFSLKLLF